MKTNNMIKQSKSQKGTFKYVHPVPLIHNTGRQAKLLRMGFTKVISSLSKGALSCKQENPPSICWQHSSLCSP